MKHQLLLILITLGFLYISCENEITECITSKEINEIEICTEEIVTKSMQPSIQTDTIDFDDYPYTLEEDSLYIESLGWKIASIIESDSLYIINSELVASKDSLLLHRNHIQDRLYGETIHSSTQHIYFMIDAEDTGEALQSFISAIDEWNNIPDCNLYFSSNYHSFNESNTYNWYSVNVEISNDDSFFNDPVWHDYYSETGIMVELPIASTSPRFPGCNMWIDATHDVFSALDSDQKKYAYMHAIGHLINLKDADKREDWIPGTSNTDMSIMTSYSYLKSWNMQWTGFTYQDKEDLAYIYPLNNIIITGVSLRDVRDNQLALRTLKLYKPYEFTADISAIKKGQNELSLDFDITGGNYEMEYVNATTVRVIFTDTGFYDIKATLNPHNLDSQFVNNHSDEQRYTVVGDAISYPGSITRNQPFELYWRYTNKQYPDATIVFSGIEHLFDKNASNITFTPIQNGRTKVTLKDFGQYTITMKAVTPAGEVLDQHKLHIEEYYHPPMDVIDTCSFFKEVPFYCFSIGNDICEEDMSMAIPASGTNTQALAVRLDTRNSFKHRCYIKAYKKYHRQLYDFARRIDVRHVTDTTSFIPLLFEKDDIALYFVPSQKLTMSAGVGGLGEDESADYTSYMAFIVPDDSIRFE